MRNSEEPLPDKQQFKKQFYLFLAVLGLHCFAGFSLAVVSRDLSLVVVCRLIAVVASLGAECGL